MLQSLAQSLVKSLGTTKETLLLLMMIGMEGEEVRRGWREEDGSEIRGREMKKREEEKVAVGDQM